MSVGFCTLAIHAPYRERARLLCSDLSSAPVFILTDEPSYFAGLPVIAAQHAPTGPMAIDYLTSMAETGNGNGAAAYHDKRFVIQSALEHFDTAIFLDADSRLTSSPPQLTFNPGLSVTTFVRRSVADHLANCGTWRIPHFELLAKEIMGNTQVLNEAKWCHEACFAVTKDGNESRFLEAWDHAAKILQKNNVFSGEGGVIGLAAAYAGWTVDYLALEPLDSLLRHESGGPKKV